MVVSLDKINLDNIYVDKIYLDIIQVDKIQVDIIYLDISKYPGSCTALVHRKQNGKGVIQFHEKIYIYSDIQEFLRLVQQYQLLEVFLSVIELFMAFWPFLPKTCTFVRRYKRLRHWDCLKNSCLRLAREPQGIS